MFDEVVLHEDEFTLPEPPWIHISIKTEKMEAFEAFCERNHIPFEMVDSSEEDTICSVRDGLDSKDVFSYMLRSTYQEGDVETVAIIHMLRQLRTGCFPQYEYELYAYRTEADEWMLSHFDDPSTLKL